ncbi:hypothetical protein NKJ93_33050 [Mesorhizobium sp. M0028]|uniref:hypothetical protein n=1 Tax=Mesorhizobium sp. M0028 TaxID=2956849 RepID=UPI00333B5D31
MSVNHHDHWYYCRHWQIAALSKEENDRIVVREDAGPTLDLIDLRMGTSSGSAGVNG